MRLKAQPTTTNDQEDLNPIMSLIIRILKIIITTLTPKPIILRPIIRLLSGQLKPIMHNE